MKVDGATLARIDGNHVRPEGVVVDAASKKFTMGVPLRQLLEELGYSPQQQARILAEANPPLKATVG